MDSEDFIKHAYLMRSVVIGTLELIVNLFLDCSPEFSYYDNIRYVIDNLKERLERVKEYLDETKKSGFLQDYAIWVYWGDYNERVKMLPHKVMIRLDLDNAWIRLNAQINCYDISKESRKDKNIAELIETNLLVIGYEALRKFLDLLCEYELNK